MYPDDRIHSPGGAVKVWWHREFPLAHTPGESVRTAGK